jgi:DNA-directed RNA polymerase specialized sigma24 family protein
MTQAQSLQVGSAADAVLELFQLAALFLGNEEEAVAAVEQTVARFQRDPCAEPQAARQEAERQLVDRCIRRAQALYGALEAPAEEEQSGAPACMETDDVDAAGLSSERIAEMLSGPGRERMRRWLDGLPPASRIVFVLRAVLGQRNEEAAASLRSAGAGPWTAAQAGRVFREALCSLASSLAHTVAPAVA